jgi:hypothetical protein
LCRELLLHLSTMTTFSSGMPQFLALRKPAGKVWYTHVWSICDA